MKEQDQKQEFSGKPSDHIDDPAEEEGLKARTAFSLVGVDHDSRPGAKNGEGEDQPGVVIGGVAETIVCEKISHCFLFILK